MNKPLLLKDLGDVMKYLQIIKNENEIAVQGDWSLDQNLAHCAQSIEFAMSGYPIEKPKLFQSTIGTLVFHYFDWKGFMRHGTNQFIPGEFPLSSDSTLNGLSVLEQAIEKFEVWDKPLFPHRFYGKLNKKQYARAHVLHIANHLELVDFA